MQWSATDPRRSFTKWCTCSGCYPPFWHTSFNSVTMVNQMRRELAGRLAAEFAIIVLGVLVALGVDDWRSGQADLKRETYFLDSLIEDLEADLVDFQAAHANAQARIAAASFVISEIGARRPVASERQSIGTSTPFMPEPDAPTPQDLTAALQQLATVANFDFATGTHEEILSTGSFGLIRSESIRRGISQYYAFAANRSEADNRIREALFQYYEALRLAGLAPGDDGELLRQIPGESRAQLTAAIRLNWGLAATQSAIAKDLEAGARRLLAVLDP